MCYPPLEGLVQILDKLSTSEPTPEKTTEVLVYNWSTSVIYFIPITDIRYYHDT
ncbi:hypothetical protein M422DRAFT_261438 [Sphaerobolus stellatus SS14]|uniref:Uncharacterized protein n=1 Tax=Sphaerobolus stellatus (strain SS14) TaxID=990650 RepID=A0A0C9VFW1_SPHS4|nr:hypothetical protein M422DRAFT_261438 [Sphaerobolus stellatus SS14]